jgi:hypothetical protein
MMDAIGNMSNGLLEILWAYGGPIVFVKENIISILRIISLSWPQFMNFSHHL